MGGGSESARVFQPFRRSHGEPQGVEHGAISFVAGPKVFDVLWKYPQGGDPFSRVNGAILKWSNAQNGGAAFELTDRVAFPGIATSVVSQIRQATGLEDFCVVGNSLGAGVVLSDYATLSSDPAYSKVRFVLVSPTEAFMPETLSGKLVRTVLVSDPSNDFYLARQQDISFVSSNINGPLPPGYLNPGHIIIGSNAPLAYVFSLIDQSFAGPAISLAGNLNFGDVQVGSSAQNTDPKLANTAPVTASVSINNSLQISFPCNATRTDITYTVQTSTTLAPNSWTDIAMSSGGAPTTHTTGYTVSDSGTGLRTVTVTDLTPLANRKFLRVKVSAP